MTAMADLELLASDGGKSVGGRTEAITPVFVDLDVIKRGHTGLGMMVQVSLELAMIA